jgi:hypothetical protein
MASKTQSGFSRLTPVGSWVEHTRNLAVQEARESAISQYGIADAVAALTAGRMWDDQWKHQQPTEDCTSKNIQLIKEMTQ